MRLYISARSRAVAVAHSISHCHYCRALEGRIVHDVDHLKTMAIVNSSVCGILYIIEMGWALGIWLG